MKFKVYTYDTKVNKSGGALVGRFEIYNSEGEFVTSSGARRVANYLPTDSESIPYKLIKDIVGVQKKVAVTQVDSSNGGLSPRLRSRYASFDRLTPDRNEQQVFEVNCV